MARTDSQQAALGKGAWLNPTMRSQTAKRAGAAVVKTRALAQRGRNG